MGRSLWLLGTPPMFRRPSFVFNSTPPPPGGRDTDGHSPCSRTSSFRPHPVGGKAGCHHQSRVLTLPPLIICVEGTDGLSLYYGGDDQREGVTETPEG